MTKVAINGFGRIGRNTFKAILRKKMPLNVVAINDLTSPEQLAYLYKYDTVYGKSSENVSYGKDYIKIGRKKINVLGQRDPVKLPWKKLKVDVVLECTGIFRTEEQAMPHLKAGAKRVIISAPSKGGNIAPFMIGVNEKKYNKEKLVDNASCTTNCIAPLAAIIDKHFGIAKAAMTTIHAYTSNQRLIDGPHKDFRRGRAAAQNIIPTTTGAAIATTKLVTNLDGLFDGISIRVPVATGSLSDFTFLLKKKTTVEQVNGLLRKIAKNPGYKSILEVTDEPIVSSDIIGNEHSAVVDLSMTKVIDGDLLKILAWYDNEWGYSNRLAEMAVLVGKTIK